MIGHPSIMQDRELLNKLYWIENKSQREIGKIYGVRACRVSKWMKRLGIKTKPWSTKGFKFAGRKLSEEHKKKLSIWHKGKKLSPHIAKLVTRNLEKTWEKNRKPIGTVVNAHTGYLSIKLDNGKWEYLHRHVASIKIGRKLEKGEEVHHIDFNVRNNKPDNLLVLKRTEHLLLHSQLERVMRSLMENGHVYFLNGEYRVR